MNKHDSMQYQIRDPKGFTNIKEWAKQKELKSSTYLHTQPLKVKPL